RPNVTDVALPICRLVRDRSPVTLFSLTWRQSKSFLNPRSLFSWRTNEISPATTPSFLILDTL
ncbi:hypothetical protein L9F63_004444, partial [Diploptera punctata]